MRDCRECEACGTKMRQGGHPSQLSNPFLGLPLESGKCEACGTAENGNCEGHFGYIELPVPIFHPSHISELRDLLSLVCLKCLRMKKAKIKDGKTNASGVACSYCKCLPPIYIKEVKTSDGAISLELSVSSRNVCANYGNIQAQSQHRKSKLLGWQRNVVAEATIASTNPTALVHHVPLGADAWKVWVDSVVDSEAILYRPTSDIYTIGQAVGMTIA